VGSQLCHAGASPVPLAFSLLVQPAAEQCAQTQDTPPGSTYLATQQCIATKQTPLVPHQHHVVHGALVHLGVGQHALLQVKRGGWEQSA